MINVMSMDELHNIKGNNYIVLRFNGLYGDMLHGSCKFQYILERHPSTPWIIVHSYADLNRVKTGADLLSYWYDVGKLKYYIHDNTPASGRISPRVIRRLRDIGIPNSRIFDCYVFQPRPRIITHPNLGISIPSEKDPKKAVIFRYSGWHTHFPKRNRPIEEWVKIERALLDKGYDVHLLGYDDVMPNPNNLNDLRRKMTVRDVLNFTKDASICITTTTFLYVWTQFVCPTAVLSEKADIKGLKAHWKLHPNMRVFNIEGNYLPKLEHFIECV